MAEEFSHLGLQAERQKAFRTLLQAPLLHASGHQSEAFVLVRRHMEYLRGWFAKNPGWHLQVNSEVIRLRKTPAKPISPLHPARDPKSGEAFSRRRYILFCLALAVLEKSERQITIHKLASEVFTLFGEEAVFSELGFTLDFHSAGDRQDLVHVVRLLLELRALVRIQGDENQFLSNVAMKFSAQPTSIPENPTFDESKRDVLYTIQRPALSAVLNVRTGPSLITEEKFNRRIQAISEEIYPNHEEGRNRRMRAQLYRKLIEEPILYFEDLDPETLAYLTHQRSRILEEIRKVSGLIPEIRQEGIALLDEENELSDFGMPEEGTSGHHALLLAEFLAEAARGAPGVPVPYAEILTKTRNLIQKHKTLWRKSAQEIGMDRMMTDEALYRFEALKLIRRKSEGIIPLPAIARYGVQEGVQEVSENQPNSRPKGRPQKNRPQARPNSQGDLFS